MLSRLRNLIVRLAGFLSSRDLTNRRGLRIGEERRAVLAEDQPAVHLVDTRAVSGDRWSTGDVIDGEGRSPFSHFGRGDHRKNLLACGERAAVTERGASRFGKWGSWFAASGWSQYRWIPEQQPRVGCCFADPLRLPFRVIPANMVVLGDITYLIKEDGRK